MAAKKTTAQKLRPGRDGPHTGGVSSSGLACGYSRSRYEPRRSALSRWWRDERLERDQVICRGGRLPSVRVGSPLEDAASLKTTAVD